MVGAGTRWWGRFVWPFLALRPSPAGLHAQHTRIQFTQLHWLLCHMGLYYFDFEFARSQPKAGRRLCWHGPLYNLGPESCLAGISIMRRKNEDRAPWALVAGSTVESGGGIEAA